MAESAAAHKEEKISEVPKINRDELKRLKSEKIAIITIGRWQPPHAGHLELIYGTYNKVIEMRKAGFRNVHGFIWITPRPDEIPGSTSNPTFINKNPLYFIDKWLYLNYIIPYDDYGKNLKFLTITDIDSDINRKIFRDDNDPNKASFLTDKHDLREGGKIQDLSMCQQEKYSSLFYYGDEDFKNFKKRTTKINVRNQSSSPSATCINFLKSRGYTQLLLLVGSDRVDAFEKYNRAHLDAAFGAGNGIIEQIGAERGSAGKGLLFDLDSGSDDDTLITKVGNFVFTKIGNIFFSINISDILYTYLLGKTNSFKKLDLKCKDFSLCVEMPIKAQRFKMNYIDIASYERKRIAGEKKVNEFQDGFKILYYMIKSFFNY